MIWHKFGSCFLIVIDLQVLWIAQFNWHCVLNYFQSVTSGLWAPISPCSCCRSCSCFCSEPALVGVIGSTTHELCPCTHPSNTKHESKQDASTFFQAFSMTPPETKPRLPAFKVQAQLTVQLSLWTVIDNATSKIFLLTLLAMSEVAAIFCWDIVSTVFWKHSFSIGELLCRLALIVKKLSLNKQGMNWKTQNIINIFQQW